MMTAGKMVCYSLATDSDIELTDEIDLANDLQTESMATDETLPYTQSINDIQSMMMFMIFFMGVCAGLIFSKIMWGRLR